jgi:2-polyprenyl-3-methyl-5-hydroxy-6-metoxy-1,4-benzoquinol methylase
MDMLNEKKILIKFINKFKGLSEIKNDFIPQKKTYWLENSELHNYSTTCMWELKTDWGHYIKEKYSLTNKVCLSIGCGNGELERGLIEIGCAKSIDAFDINPSSIDTAKKIANEKGYSINYFTADANEVILENNRYDIVFAHNSVHHIKNLEHTMHQISGSMKKDGLFIMVEYTGPNRFHWSEKQQEIINNLLEILPQKLKKIDSVGSIYRTKISYETMKNYLDSDPSEAIRSEDILPVTEKYFKILEKRDMGGTILHMLFAEIVNNFDNQIEEERTIVKLLCYFEKMLIESYQIPSDFKLIICKKI